ncbi:hypothetical protein [Streptomyces sp. NPDC020951]|uniref:hypothetical protein n=1 Tax=Streptomyces sp. NPDC020951 TaxID=3365104 RepID=UPI0037A7A3F6
MQKATWLSSWGTMLSALAAALGLVFTGIVAWFSVSATRQELEQDRRFQASKVTFWTERPTENEYITIISNRSVDAVTDIEMLFRVPPFGRDRTYYAGLRLDGIPPCTRISIPEDLLGNLIRGMEYKLRGSTSPDSIQFYDSNGTPWVRGIDALRTGEISTESSGPWGDDDAFLPPNVKIEPAQYCDI